MSDKIKTKCIECGKIVPYQGRGRPRQRHMRCMDSNQKRERQYMKSYMPKYYARGDNLEKHKAYVTKKRREDQNETQN